MISVAFDIRRLVDAHLKRQPYQGITRYTLRLYEQLRARGDVVQVVPVYLHPLDPKRLGLDRALQQSMGLESVVRSLGDSVTLPWSRSRPGGSLFTLLDRLQGYLDWSRILAGGVRRCQQRLLESSYQPSAQCSLRTDVFHSPVNPLPPVHRTPSSRRVLTVHDCIYLKRPDLYPLTSGTPTIRLALNRLTPDDFVICDSEHTRNDLLELIEFPSAQAHVVPLAADDLFHRPDREAGLRCLAEVGVPPGQFLLALAQSEKRKNIIRLVEAFRRSDASRNLDLLLVAGERHAAELHRELENRSLTGDRVRIISGVDDSSLSGLLALAVAFVYVPLYEGFGIPILEAMAAGCPVVCANNSSLPEVAGEAARYVDALDPTCIAAGIDEVAGSPSIREELRAGGLARARRFSWDRTATETLAVYDQMLASTKKPTVTPYSVAQ